MIELDTKPTPNHLTMLEIHNTTYKYFQDPSHGWLEVPLNHLKYLGIVGDISGFSYINSGKAYLEEDSDMAKFIDAWQRSTGLTFQENRIQSIHQENTPIRNYNHFPGKTIHSSSERI